MSSTRHADADSPFRQERFASSVGFERGLLANLVARRCSALDDKADRELIWAIHYFSHLEGGLKKLAGDLLEKFADRIGTPTMLKLGKTAAQNFSTDEMREIRLELPANLRRHFPLKGELKSEVRDLQTKYDRLASQAERATALRAYAENSCDEVEYYQDLITGALEEKKRLDRQQAAKHPASYPVAMLREFCLRAAVNGVEAWQDYPATPNLERTLTEICLNPEWNLKAPLPWYFSDLIPVLRRYFENWATQHSAGVVITALGKMVHETLDYTMHAKTMTLLEGQARTGKSFSARHWCESHPGQARFVEVPTGNDDSGFFRALARGLGLGSFQQYKAVELRERVENVLLTGDLLLCLDEGHRLWPQVNARFGYPKRIEWVMSMANQGVAICLICTPQFLERQHLFAQNKGWNSAQFIGRLGDYKQLPAELSLEDLTAVAGAVLPEADSKTLRALAAYARTSARYLAAIDAIAKRARYNAQRAGRELASTEDVRTAMQASVIPSDSNLVRAIDDKKSPKTSGRLDRMAGAASNPESAIPEIIPSAPSRGGDIRRHQTTEPVLTH